MHKPYYLLYFSKVFFWHKFLGFLCISCKGCPQTILFLVRTWWSRYLPGSFRMGEHLDCSFYFMSCLCRHMITLYILQASFCIDQPGDPDLWYRCFYRHCRSTSHLTFNLERNGKHWTAEFAGGLCGSYRGWVSWRQRCGSIFVCIMRGNTSRVPGCLSGFDGKRHLPGVYNESARHAGVGARVSFL